jgi:hypothetical protein
VDYAHDIFISYRRDPEVVSWIQDHLVPLLRLHVGHELGDPPNIYTDQRIEGGATWPVDLGIALARSKVLISLWSGNYLHSKWCTLELAHMVAREKGEGCRTPQNSLGVVFFLIVHDAESIPADLKAIQRVDIIKCFSVRMRRDSNTAEELDKLVTENARAIALLIQNAPQFRENWPEQTATAFFNQFHQNNKPRQITVPQFT